MKIQNLLIVLGICLSCYLYTHTLQAQQWLGSSNSSNNIHRMGNVGIGTTNPTQKLHVIGDAMVSGHISAGGTNQGGLLNAVRGNEPWSYGIISKAGSRDVKAFAVIDNGGEKFKVMGDGRTYIGAASPAWEPAEALLWVDGLVTAEEVRIKLSQNWPDYVFTTDYEMPSLAEVDQFIQANGHLPNTPSAKIVEKEGSFEVGKMTVNQQEKIEQVFLHLIEMDKKLQKLAAENAALKEEIATLKK
ncbi:MAG: hypothetical protein AAF734_04005 [Bacteroidota bacterium]